MSQELYERYQAIFKQIDGDDELMLKVLVEQFGSVRDLWFILQESITSLEDIDDLDEEDALEEIQNLEESFNKVINETIESEFLMDRIDTITKTAEGFKLHTSAGKDVEITDREVKEKIVLINREPAFDHFAGLMEESDVMEVFKIVDLFYVE
jgi:hypothetical protein